MLRAAFAVMVLFSLAGCGAADGGDASTGDTDAGARDASVRDAAIGDAAIRDAGADAPGDASIGADDGGGLSDAGPLGTWGEGFLLPPPDGRDSFAQFGSSVAIGARGERVAVGDIGSGQVSVYEPDGDGWVRVDVLEPAAGVSSFGWDIDFDADATTLAVSAPPQRVVFVFERGATGWSVPTEVRASGAPAGFGTSIALSADGRRLVVGAASVEPSQGVFVFDRIGDAWNDGVPLALPAGTVEAGSRVAIDAAGVRLVSGDTGRSARPGSAAVYDRGQAGWGAPQPLALPVSVDVFAFDVAISGDGTTLAVSDSFLESGVVTTYRRLADTWAPEAIPAPPGAVQFGYAIAFDGAGATLWSGDTATAGGGQVTEHVRDADGWRYADTLPSPEGVRDFGFAIDVSADGRTLVASDLNGGEGDMGTAFVFRR